MGFFQAEYGCVPTAQTPERNCTGAVARSRVPARPDKKGRLAMTIEAYCMKCKEKQHMQNHVQGTTKNGKPITKGTCPVCGSTICRIGAAK